MDSLCIDGKMYWNPVILIKSAAIQYHVKLHLELVDSESLMPLKGIQSGHIYGT